MFQEWGFLLGEIWILILLAALLGLLAGWLIWGGRESNSLELEQARGELSRCEATCEEKDAVIVQLRNALSACEDRCSTMETAAEAEPEPEPEPFVEEPVVVSAVDPEPEVVEEAVKPVGLTEARGGAPDDLKLIKGIGPKLELLCHSLGYYHFDQIAAWTDSEVAWVDEHLEGFKGRVTRDQWVAQAKALMSS